MFESVLHGPHFNFPQRQPASLYYEAVDYLVSKWSRLPNPPVAIYQLGSVAAPGISDLDFMVVVPDSGRVDAAALDHRTVPDWMQPLMTHRAYCCTQSAWRTLPAWYPTFNLRHLWGERLEDPLASSQLEPGCALGFLIDYLTIKVPSDFLTFAWRQPVDVRVLLCMLHSLKYTSYLTGIAGLEIPSGTEEACRAVDALRAEWFALEQAEQLARLRALTEEACAMSGRLIEAVDRCLCQEAGRLPNVQHWSVPSIPCEFHDTWNYGEALARARQRFAESSSAVWTNPASFLHVFGFYGSLSKDMAIHLWQMGMWLPDVWAGGRWASGLRQHASAMMAFGASASRVGIPAEKYVALGFEPVPTRLQRLTRNSRKLLEGELSIRGMADRLRDKVARPFDKVERASRAHQASVARSLDVNRGILRRAAAERPAVLIGLVEHFGDIVACEPVASHVRRTHPDAIVGWCVRKPYRELIDCNPNVDFTIAVECLSEWIDLRSETCCACVVDLHVNGRICPVCMEPVLKTAGDPNVTAVNYFQYGSLLTAFCAAAGIPELREQPRVYTDQRHRDAIDRLALPERFVAIHAASNDEKKDWLNDRWDRLAREIRARLGIAVVEVGLRPVFGESSGALSVCGKLGLLDTAELIRRARLFVGVDSGPAHLANAVDTPGVLLFGTYRGFDEYMPYTGAYADGSNAWILRSAGPASELPYETVFAAVEKALLEIETGGKPGTQLAARG